MTPILFYVHDPMCSWCWGFRPIWDQLKAELPSSVMVENVVGGLAADTDHLMPKDMQQAIQDHWHKIHQLLGTEFNFDFWTNNHPRRSTYPACRAVIAAKVQGYEEEMINAIQRAYYLRALNPSDTDVLMCLAWDLFSQELNIDLDQFSNDMASAETEHELQRQIALSKVLPAIGFPSLILEVNGEQTLLTRDYQNHEAILKQIHHLLTK